MNATKSLKPRTKRRTASNEHLQVQRVRQLAVEKQRCLAGGQTWRSYVREELGLSRERADELIRIGTGLLSVEASRAGKRERQQLSRSRTGRPYAKRLLLVNAERSERACSSIRRRLDTLRASRDEIDAMSGAARRAIAAWDALLRTVEALTPRA